MGYLRTKESEDRYDKLIAEGFLDGKCKLCEASSIQDFTHWRIIRNKFPYDRIAQIHNMVIPKRHVREDELSKEEKEEYETIKRTHVNDHYEFIIEPTLKMRSIPQHFHVHLLITKD